MEPSIAAPAGLSVYGGPNTQVSAYTTGTTIVIVGSSQTTTGSIFGIDDLFSGVYLNRRSSYNGERDRRWREREARFKALAERWRRVMTASHRVPPVAVELASLPLPTPPVNARVAGAGWHRRAHGGPRERSAHRRRLRTWERAAA